MGKNKFTKNRPSGRFFLMMKINEIIQLNILRLGSNGEGVANHQGLTIFVQGALPKERVLAKITLVKKNYALASLQKILEEAPERVSPPCSIYAQCGGCQLQHYAYEAQLQAKTGQVQDALQRIGHLGSTVLPALGMKNPWFYRNKMQLPVQNKEGLLEIGCYAQKTHGVIDTKNCLIQESANNQVLFAMRFWMEKYAVAAYDEKSAEGLVRHIMARTGFSKDGKPQVLAVLIATKANLPFEKELVDILCSKVKNLVGVVVNINSKKGNIILGKQCRTIWGRDYLLDCLGSLEFKVSPLSFFQVNRSQAQVLYSKVLEFADLKGDEKVADIYCGTGTISLYLALRAKKVYGIEIVPQAIDDAKDNALANGISNASFLVGDAAEELPKLLSQGFRPDIVVVDPPRAGCEEKVLESILKVEPQKIIYVSCNPATLARDLGILRTKYKILKVQPIDMFPQTTHVETVVELIRI